MNGRPSALQNGLTECDQRSSSVDEPAAPRKSPSHITQQALRRRVPAQSNELGGALRASQVVRDIGIDGRQPPGSCGRGRFRAICSPCLADEPRSAVVCGTEREQHVRAGRPGCSIQ